ncbi:Multiple stress resistance protein BhsA precursor [compost metagenome]
MKNLKITIAAIALATASFGSFAADLVNAQPADLQKAGVVTVSGASDLTSLENKLAAKADEAGAKSFQISQLPATTSCTVLRSSTING